MIIDSLEESKKLAKQFLATKKRKNYYGFTVYYDIEPDMVTFTHPLEDEEVKRLRMLKKKYDERFVRHLDEVFDDAERVNSFTHGFELMYIDLDHITHKYDFGCHQMKPDGTITSTTVSIELSDNDYITLLAWHIFHEPFNMNVMRICESGLCNTIMRNMDNHFRDFDMGTLRIEYPYLVTLDEAASDCETIVKQNDIQRNEFASLWM